MRENWRGSQTRIQTCLSIDVFWYMSKKTFNLLSLSLILISERPAYLNQLSTALQKSLRNLPLISITLRSLFILLIYVLINLFIYSRTSIKAATLGDETSGSFKQRFARKRLGAIWLSGYQHRYKQMEVEKKQNNGGFNTFHSVNKSQRNNYVSNIVLILPSSG